MSKIVVISGHPDLSQSFTNTVILDALKGSELDLEIRRLDLLYPDFQIDAAQEQHALLSADVIVLQYPFYWYSVPGILKHWLDQVFTYNFAYGAEGTKLKDKDLVLSFTIGGPKDAYQPLGYNHFTIEQLILPLQQTAYLAGMNFQPPVYSHGMVFIPGVYNTQEDVEARASEHAERLVSALSQLTDSAKHIIATFTEEWFATFDTLPADNQYFLNHLSDNLHLEMLEGHYKGHAGFRDWYSEARQTFKPGCEHRVERLDITPSGNKRYSVNMSVRLLAETYENEAVDLRVAEIWQLKLDEDDQVLISDYRVIAV